jgi:hypothetical protein
MKNVKANRSSKGKTIQAVVMNEKNTKKNAGPEKKFGCPPADI